MRRLAVTIAVLAMVPAPSMAAEYRLATDDAFSRLLVGCWSNSSGDTCFDADGIVRSSVFHTDAEGLLSGGEGVGTFEIQDNRLVLKSQTDFWAFPLTMMTCDATIVPEVSLTLTDCFDPELSKDTQDSITIELALAEAVADVTLGDIVQRCWRKKPTQAELDDWASRTITLEDGSKALVWARDKETGAPLIEIIPGAEFCLKDDNTFTSWVWGGDEGLGSSGTYTLDGASISFETEWTDGWLFGLARVICDIVPESYGIRLTNCIGTNGNDPWQAKGDIGFTPGEMSDG